MEDDLGEVTCLEGLEVLVREGGLVRFVRVSVMEEDGEGCTMKYTPVVRRV